MAWINVTSSAFKAARYSRDHRRLDILYHNGSIYRSHHVPERAYIKLVNHASPGTYLNEEVKPLFSFYQLNHDDDVTESSKT